MIPETRITDNRRFFAGQNKKVVFGSANIDDPYPTNARIVSGGAADGKYSIACEATTPESLVQQHVAGDIALLKWTLKVQTTMFCIAQLMRRLSELSE